MTVLLRSALLAVSASVLLVGCVVPPLSDEPRGPHYGEEPVAVHLVASFAQSGGMIGLNDTIQVTSDGRIHSDRRGIGTRIRQLDRGEEARLQSLLGRFAVLDSFQDDRAFDGFMTKVWARGHGLGQGSETDAQELGDFLRRCIGFDVYQPPPIPPSFPEIPNVPPDPNWPMDPEGP